MRSPSLTRSPSVLSLTSLFMLAGCCCGTHDSALSVSEYRTVSRVNVSPVVYSVCAGPAGAAHFDWAYGGAEGGAVGSASLGPTVLTDQALVLKTGRRTLATLIQVPAVEGQARALIVIGADDSLTSVLVSAGVGDARPQPVFRCLQQTPIAAGAGGNGAFWMSVAAPQLCDLCPTGGLALLRVTRSGVQAKHCISDLFAAAFHPSRPVGAAPVDGGVLRFTFDDTGVRKDAVVAAELRDWDFVAFYPLTDTERLFVPRRELEALDVVWSSDAGVAVPSWLSGTYFRGMTSVDGHTVDAINKTASALMTHTTVWPDGGLSSEEVALPPGSTEGELAPHLGRPALFATADAGNGVVELKGRYLR